MGWRRAMLRAARVMAGAVLLSRAAGERVH